MSIPESAVVSVTLSASQQATSQNGFGLTCLFGESTFLPVAQRFDTFSGIDDVGTVYPTDSPEYLAASVYFAADADGNSAAELMIARMFTTAVAAELIGAPVQTTLAQFNAVAAGALTMTIDGALVNASAIDLSAAANMPAVAAAIQAALVALKPAVTVTWNAATLQFTVQSGTTGVLSTLTFSVAPPAGTDLGPLMGITQTAGAVLAQGQAAETLAQSLENVFSLSPTFYEFALAYGPSDADIETAAAFALANSLVYGYMTVAPGCALATVTNDIGSVLKASTNKRVIGFYDQLAQNPYGIMSVLAKGAQVDFTGTDTDEILMFQQLPGVSVSPISTGQKKILDGKNLNYYISVGGNPMFATGVMADGTYFDTVQGLDWLSSVLQGAVFGGLYTGKKFPQTDKGMANLMHLMQAPANQAVANGFLAPGVWNGPSIGQISTGDTLNAGFYIFAASVDTQTQAVRNTRVGPPIQFIGKGAGALQGINIIINFEE